MSEEMDWKTRLLYGIIKCPGCGATADDAAFRLRPIYDDGGWVYSMDFACRCGQAGPIPVTMRVHAGEDPRQISLDDRIELHGMLEAWRGNLDGSIPKTS